MTLLSSLLQRLRPRYPVVRQYDRIDCGPAALLSVLRFHGGDASLVHVREQARTDARGSTMLSLVRAAGALGFRARGAQGEYDELMRETMPCIAHVVMDERLSHFVVVYRIDERGVLLGDPGRGRVRLSRAEFEAIWTERAVVLLEPTDRLVRLRSPHWSGWIVSHLRRHETWVVQSVFLGVAYTVLGLLTAVFVQWVIDRFIPEGDLTKIVLTGLALLALQLCRGAAGYLRQRFVVELNQRVGVAVAEDFLGHIFRLPARFFDTRKTGDTMARINDSVKIQNAVLRILGTTIADALIIVGSLAFLFVLARPLGWLALGAVPLYAAILLRATRRLKDAQSEAVRAYAQVESSYVDGLGGIEAIRSFDADGAFARLTTGLYRAFQDRTVSLGMTQARISLQAELAGGALVMGALILGAALVVGGTLQLGQMMAAYSLLANMIPSTLRLVDANVALQGASIAATRLMDLLLVDAERDEGDRPFALERALEVRGGVFTWMRGEPLLRGVDLRVERGRITGLWGVSGAGKSTLVRVLERHYPLAGGELLADGVPAAEFPLSGWRRGVATVPETVKIFNATLAENVLLGRDSELPSLQRRVEEMGFGDFVRDRFPAGLLTVVGEEARQLSSGERQVVGLMRAMLDGPAVLIVDEGINAIDVHVVGLIFRTLRAYARDHAVLLISHNLRTLLRADRLYLLEEGRITEAGAPAELLERAGRFRALWEMQDSDMMAEIQE